MDCLGIDGCCYCHGAVLYQQTLYQGNREGKDCGGGKTGSIEAKKRDSAAAEWWVTEISCATSGGKAKAGSVQIGG